MKRLAPHDRPGGKLGRLGATARGDNELLAASLVHSREVFQAASGAAAVFVFHNHPSGDPAPGRNDIKLMTRLVKVGGIMGIDVLDHLVLADAA